MILEFELNVGTPALTLERLRRRQLGRYRHGRNGFGLLDEIAVGKEHTQGSPFWQVLGTLLHELLHSWQNHNGHPGSLRNRNYHNQELRDRAKGLGLLIDQWGRTEYAPGDTPFLSLLREYGVEAPQLPVEETLPLPAGRSKLVLYKCPCGVKVRVGRSRFNAQCLDCGGVFERKG